LTSSETRFFVHLPHRIKVGCGNGHFLFSLHAAGYPTRLLQGVDYSRSAIELCIAIAQSKGVEGIEFILEDVTRKSTESDGDYSGSFDLVADKGVRLRSLGGQCVLIEALTQCTHVRADHFIDRRTMLFVWRHK
jgi:hypothetical protein